MRGDPRSVAGAARRVASSVRRKMQQQVPGAHDERDLIITSGLFDPSWIGAQLGRIFGSDEEAVDAYLQYAGTCSPHVLFWGRWIDKSRGFPPRGVSALGWYLQESAIHDHISPHPSIDLDVLREEDPGLWHHKHGPVVGWVQAHGMGRNLPTSPGARPRTWQDVDAVSRAAIGRWREANRLRQAPRTSGRPTIDLVEPSPQAAASPPTSHQADTPLVSVVMPVFNRAHLLRRAVESVQAQSLQDWELILVDDGSSDDSVAVALGLAHFDHRIIVVPGDHRGVSAARNVAISRARAPYVSFLDTDNVWRRDFLLVMVTAMIDGSLSMAHAALRATRAGETYYRTFEGSYEHMLVSAYVDLNVLVVARDALQEVGGFDEDLRRAVDYDLALKLAERHSPHLVPYVGVEYTDDAKDDSRISVAETPRWLSVVVDRHQTEWTQNLEETPGLTSVVVQVETGTSVRETWARLRSFAAQDDLEVVVVAISPRRWQLVMLELLVDSLPRASVVVQIVGRGSAAALNMGLASCHGERVVLAAAPEGIGSETARALSSALDDPDVTVVQPVVLDSRDLVLSAGAVYTERDPLPRPWLDDHPMTDAQAIRGEFQEVPALWGPVVGGRRSDLVAARGFDPLLPWPFAATDLSRRMVTELGGTCVVKQACSARGDDAAEAMSAADAAEGLALLRSRRPLPPPGSEQAWRSAGFEVVSRQSEILRVDDPQTEIGAQDLVSRWPKSIVRRIRPDHISESPPSLRWTIDTAAHAGVRGQHWGDVHFAEALARALRGLGQQVAVDRREARHRSTRDLDDVVLTLRGLDRVLPWPGAINLQWIISHPELVSATEVAGYDRVYAASEFWAAQRQQQWGVQITPLLQATDPELFKPFPELYDTGQSLLFVGNSRGVFRSSVRNAMAIDADVTIIGNGWHGIIGHDVVSNLYVENAEVAPMYSAAGIVLNDHWEEMRLLGFVSNRLMDAAACGARVATDPLPQVDLAHLFGGLVHVYEGPGGLRDVMLQRDSVFPSADERTLAANRVRERHSFTSRAQQLLDDVVAIQTRGSDQR